MKKREIRQKMATWLYERLEDEMDLEDCELFYEMVADFESAAEVVGERPLYHSLRQDLFEKPAG